MFPSIWVVSLTALATACSTRLRPSRVAMWVASGPTWTHMRYRPDGRLYSSPRRPRRPRERRGAPSPDGAGAEASTGPPSSTGRWTWAPCSVGRRPRPRPPRRPRLRPPPRSVAGPGEEPAPAAAPLGAGLVCPIFGAGLVSPTFGADEGGSGAAAGTGTVV